MTLSRTWRLLACSMLAIFALAAPAAAKVDLACSSSTAASAIEGTVRNAQEQPVKDIRIELYTTNRNVPLPDAAITDVNGRYRICVGQPSGGGFDTYDVHARAPVKAAAPLYATASQPYSTLTNFTSDADFTNATRNALLYMASLTISPNAISTARGVRTSTGDVPVTWTIRSKAPTSTRFALTLGHLGDRTFSLTSPLQENGGPAAGGWNVWSHAEILARDSTENLYWASMRGYAPDNTEITQFDREPYTVDNTRMVFGAGDTNGSPIVCAPGSVANPFTPSTTTNPRPVVTHGVCDPYVGGSRSGPDPYSLTGKMCRDQAMTDRCIAIQPYLNANTITWFSATHMDLGMYYFSWHIADYAGNPTDSPQVYPMQVANAGGQTPTFTAVSPGNVGSGTTAGVVIGSSLTTPSSYPFVGFRALDADGQFDLVPGTLRLRIYYGDERTLVYDYDPFMAKNEFNPITLKGGGDFDLSTGLFRCSGYPLQGKPPGRYIANVSVTDHGGNNASFTWHWILAGAA